jgi:type IV pilus assembly protein PilE
MKKYQRGMSLIELMIVVAIIGILVAIAYPSYRVHVIKTRKTDAIALINKVIQAQERYFVNNLTYIIDLTQLGFASANDLPSDGGHYLISAEACGDGIATCVNITTDAQGSQDTNTPADDDLALNSQGTKAGKWPNDY